MTSDDLSIEALMASLASPERHEKSVALIRLGQLGAQRALPEIVRSAGDPDDLIAVSACYAQWKLSGKARGIDRLIDGLGSEDEETMQLSVMALGEMGEDAVAGLREAVAAGSPHAHQIARILSEIADR